MAALLIFLVSGCEKEPSGVRALPECQPHQFEVGRYLIDVDSNGIHDNSEQMLDVVERSPRSIRVATGEGAEPDQAFVAVSLSDEVPSDVQMPLAESLVTAIGVATCWGGYVRLSGDDGRILFEGGNPSCAGPACLDAACTERFDWPRPALFVMHERPDAPECRTRTGPLEPSDECCCATGVDWEIALVVDGAERVIPVGQSVEVTIDGARYVAGVTFAKYWHKDPCSSEGTGFSGSAYLAALPD